MAKKSAGILLYRIRNNEPEFFLVHPGGPFWKNKDKNAWSIPKGEFDTEDPLVAAQREFEEETGFSITGDFIPLTPVRLKSGKRIHAFAISHDLDAANIRSNNFLMEWPPRSGKKAKFPEVDRAGWFTASDAGDKIIAEQYTLIAELRDIIQKKN